MTPFLKQSQIVFSDEAAADTTLRVAGIAAGTCAGLPVERRAEILRLAREGLEQLRRSCDWTAPDRTAGLESEMHLVERGRPSHLPAKLCAEPGARAMRVVPESGRHVVEFNSTVRACTGSFLCDYEEEIRRQIAFTLDHPLSRELKAALCPAGILPSFLADDMTLGSVTANPRYTQLHQTITRLSEENIRHLRVEARGTAGATQVTVSNARLDVVSPDIRFSLTCDPDSLLPFALKAAMASVQFHWSVPDIDAYVPAHRLADLIAGPMVAIAANSPLFGGYVTGLKATRLALWPAGSHPRRVGLGDSWIDDPLEQFEQILRNETAFAPLLDPVNAGKTAHRVLSPLDALLEHSKTFWRTNRTTVGPDGALRIEHRPVCIAPSVTDGIATAALFYGLMSGLPAALERRYGFSLDSDADTLEKRLPYHCVRENLDSAMAWGLDATVTWVDGTEHRARDLFTDELMPIAREGLEMLAVPADSIDHYLETMERRLAHSLPGRGSGTIPADVQLFLYDAIGRRASARGTGVNLEEKTVALVRLLSRVLVADTADAPCDILQWLERNSGGDAPGAVGADVLDQALRASDS